MMNKNLKWRHYKALNQIYEQGFTKNKIKDHPYVRYLLDNDYLQPQIGKPDILEEGIGFKSIYGSELKTNYSHFLSFLTEEDLITDQSNYSERDILSLMFIKEQKNQILQDQYSRKKFSAVFFKDSGAKHLDKNPGLETAVLKLLELKEFPEKDPKNQQYKFVINCPNPKRIVLCENLDFLLLPWIARENNIELWYAGGNNIEKLNHLPKIELPIFYSCDWDYDGLRIFQRVKNIIPEIELLIPTSTDFSKSVKSPNHKSDWIYTKNFSNLDYGLYSNDAKKIIEYLIRRKEWIEEETMDLIELLSNMESKIH